MVIALFPPATFTSAGTARDETTTLRDLKQALHIADILIHREFVLET